MHPSLGDGAACTTHYVAAALCCPVLPCAALCCTDLADVCHARGALLIVDEAHGAHFAFQPRAQSPHHQAPSAAGSSHGKAQVATPAPLQLPPTALSCGADLVVQSTHKMLSAMTQVGAGSGGAGSHAGNYTGSCALAYYVGLLATWPGAFPRTKGGGGTGRGSTLEPSSQRQPPGASTCHVSARGRTLVRRPHHALTCPAVPCTRGACRPCRAVHFLLACGCAQAAMLHARGPRVDAGRVSRVLQALQSSSPSYVLMASLDAARAQLQLENEEEGGGGGGGALAGALQAAQVRRVCSGRAGCRAQSGGAMVMGVGVRPDETMPNDAASGCGPVGRVHGAL